MAAYWFTFKPQGPTTPMGWPIEELQRLVTRFNEDPTTAEEWWRIQAYRRAKIGDRAYLFQQGNPRGIFGIGRIVDGPEVKAVATDAAGARPRALIRFDRLVDPTREFLLPLHELETLGDPKQIKDLVEAAASGRSVPEDIEAQIEDRLSGFLSANEAANEPFDPANAKDAREKVLREIRARRGQKQFRDALIDAYEGRCAITGCDVLDVLEAAHITPYLGPDTNHVSNGLLLRADLHTLFDTSLIAVDPKTLKVLVAPRVKDPTYRLLHGQTLRATKTRASAPSQAALRQHRTDCDF